MVPKRLLSVLISALPLLTTSAAEAAISLCVDVRAPAADLEGLRKLVRAEIGKHPSHHTVESDCRSSLAVELFDTMGARYLTAQIDREVPVRFAIKEPLDLGERVSDAVRLTLHNDPVYLTEDITHYNKLQRLGHSVGVHGRFAFRVEIFEALSRGGTNAVFAPGAAIGLTRGSGHWQVLGRAYFGGSPGAIPGTDRALQVITGLDGGLSFEVLEKAFASPYVAACAGAQFLRFGGREQANGARVDHVNHLGVTASLRLGVRMFRWHTFDLDVFTQGYLPLFITRDADGALFSDGGLYTPSVQAGIGVGF